MKVLLRCLIINCGVHERFSVLQMPQMLLQFTKWPSTGVPLHSWVRTFWTKKKRPGSRKSASVRRLSRAYMGCRKATNTSLEQTMGFVRLLWREHTAIRHPSGRHPVFTGKPLKPGLMHSKHTSLHKRGWWLSGPFLRSPLLLLHVIGGLLNRQSSGDEGCFIRSGSPEPGAHMNPLDIYSSSLAASVRFAYCHFLLRRGGRMGSVQTSSDETPPLLLYLFEEAIVPHFGNQDRY